MSEVFDIVTPTNIVITLNEQTTRQREQEAKKNEFTSTYLLFENGNERINGWRKRMKKSILCTPLICIYLGAWYKLLILA